MHGIVPRLDLRQAFLQTLKGNSLLAVQVTPSALNFNVEVVGTTDYTNVQSALLTNTGNAPVQIASVTTSPNFTLVTNSGCQQIYAQGLCAITVAFTPLVATPTGPVSGTLRIVDNAPGSPHIVKLSGNAFSVAQRLRSPKP